jgi:uncharacterized protein YndB with AHSA1/START domain
MTEEVSATVHIDAPPEKVYDLVADITRMPQWSPETYRTEWLGGATTARPGARFRGSNRYGWMRWTTTVEVETAERGREFTFVTIVRGRRMSRWTYRFSPSDGGTDVTETFRYVTPPPRLLSALFDLLTPGRNRRMVENLRTTLERLKAAAEAEG